MRYLEGVLRPLPGREARFPDAGVGVPFRPPPVPNVQSVESLGMFSQQAPSRCAECDPAGL